MMCNGDIPFFILKIKSINCNMIVPKNAQLKPQIICFQKNKIIISILYPTKRGMKKLNF